MATEPTATDLASLGAYDYVLPNELIAQHPAAERSAARLLDASDPAHPGDRRVHDLPSLLQPGDLLVVNDTRVIKARLHGAKASGGRVEALVERVLPGHEALVHLRASKSPPSGSRIDFAPRVGSGTAFSAQVLGRGGADGSLYRLRFDDEPHALLERHGHVPLPPYIAHADDADDVRRYQTVFAAHPGAVAAPTASLHFDAPLLAALAARGVECATVTLHVGAGTFLPMRSDDLATHRMHSEWCDVPAATVGAVARTRARGGRVVAVGTTTLRTLEAAALDGTLHAGARETDLFVRPGFAFKVVDALVTNFHLPKSTLLVLVSAFAGHAPVMRLYAHGVAARYRFFSYGDAMLLWRSEATVGRTLGPATTSMLGVLDDAPG